MRSPVELAIFSAIFAGAVAGAWIYNRRSLTPAEAERLRRETVNARGRLIDGNVHDVRDGVLYYRYSWRGIEYHAAQDVTGLNAMFQGDPEILVGAVTIKFLPRNPSNSIVLCEQWSGFPRHKVAVPRIQQQA